MSGQDWIQLNQFSQLANWDLLFDVNVLKRNIHGQWSPRNAHQLMAFSVHHGFTNITWELGNELKAWAPGVVLPELFIQFAEAVSNRIRAIDPNHLITLHL